MHYYKSTELADLYGVSRRTVTNWVKQTQEGKLGLELFNKDGSAYVLKSEHNQLILQTLVHERRKYVNTRSSKIASPTPDFYKTYSDQQIHDIIRSLNVIKELPLQYSYIGEGAMIWDQFRTRPNRNFDPEILIPANISYLNTILDEYDYVNIVDIGVGNGSGAKSLVSQLHKNGKLKRYIGLDISPNMLEITAQNMKEWFDNEVKCETYVRDITTETFSDLISEPPDTNSKETSTINLVLLLGGTISNFKNPSDVLRVIHRSMSQDDILLTSFRLATPTVKHQLGFINSYQKQVKSLLDMMGLDESYYKTEIGFDEEMGIRFGRIRMKHSAEIEFKLQKGTWYVNLAKDETILTFRAHFNDIFSVPKTLFYDNGFNPLLISQRLNHEGALIIADLKK